MTSTGMLFNKARSQNLSMTNGQRLSKCLISSVVYISEMSTYIHCTLRMKIDIKFLKVSFAIPTDSLKIV